MNFLLDLTPVVLPSSPHKLCCDGFIALCLFWQYLMIHYWTSFLYTQWNKFIIIVLNNNNNINDSCWISFFSFLTHLFDRLYLIIVMEKDSWALIFCFSLSVINYISLILFCNNEMIFISKVSLNHATATYWNILCVLLYAI